MHIPKRKSEKTGIDEAMDTLLDEMAGYHGSDKEYAVMVEQLTKLNAIKDSSKPERVKPDTWAIIGGNAFVALVIVAFEQHHVVTTKVASFITKLR